MKKIVFAARVGIFSLSTCLLPASTVVAQPFPLTLEEMRFQMQIDNIQQRQRWQSQQLDRQHQAHQRRLRLECQQHRQWLQMQHLPHQFLQAQRQLFEVKCQPHQLPVEFPPLGVEAGTGRIQTEENSLFYPLNYSCAQGYEGSCEQLRQMGNPSRQ